MGLLPLVLCCAAGLQDIDLRALAFESALLQAVNVERQQHQLAPVPMDPRLRLFARAQGDLAAHGAGSVAGTERLIREQGLAPLGHRLYYSAAAEPAAVLADLRAHAPHLLSETFAQGGVGAFYVPDTPPYFQVVLLFVSAPDPMLGQPGLSVAQTDAVMFAAEPQFLACYDRSLKTNPSLGGDVLLQLSIGPGGKPSHTSLLRRPNDLGLSTCLLRTAGSLRFPEPYRQVPVTLIHPFRFIPPKGGAQVRRLDTDQIQAAFAPAAAELKACYTARLQQRPGLVGTVTLAAEVTPLGTLTGLDVLHDAVGDGPLLQCVLARAARVRFAPAQAGASARFTYPLHFGL